MKQLFNGKTAISSVTAICIIVIAVLSYFLLESAPLDYNEWSNFERITIPLALCLNILLPVFGLATASLATTKRWKIVLTFLHAAFCLFIIPLASVYAFFTYVTISIA
ncbi:hypothetical protein [Terribacillus saccharophilus]|uniref:hypothetical protein n=1 Tax=Terribacillus saccharophilus TaxID=361277 RepID=UPI002989BAB0|nr:hypothetical protein [Terribacillus saccharophilus]MCM3227365.1 hypothetical protein [Terribacillus saccharophilus]